MAVDLLNTKFSDIDSAFVKQYMHIEAEFTEDDVTIQLLLDTAKSFILEHSQLTVEELDAAKSVNIIYLKLVSDLYHNRTATSGKNVDPFFELVFKNLRNYNNLFGTPE